MGPGSVKDGEKGFFFLYHASSLQRDPSHRTAGDPPGQNLGDVKLEAVSRSGSVLYLHAIASYRIASHRIASLSRLSISIILVVTVEYPYK